MLLLAYGNEFGKVPNALIAHSVSLLNDPDNLAPKSSQN
jgi:hypothetical protein